MIAQANVRHLPLADNSVDLIFTDPPYPKQYLPCYGWLAAEAMRVLKPSGFLLAMCGGLYLNQIYRMFDDAGLTYYFELLHYNVGGDRPVIWPRRMVAAHKQILAYSKGAGTSRTWNVISVFESARMDKRFHHWGQDVESARYYIDCFSAEGDLVCDPFIGGGTTAVACELIKRRCVSFDVDMNACLTTRGRLANAGILHQGMFAGMAL